MLNLSKKFKKIATVICTGLLMVQVSISEAEIEGNRFSDDNGIQYIFALIQWARGEKTADTVEVESVINQLVENPSNDPLTTVGDNKTPQREDFRQKILEFIDPGMTAYLNSNPATGYASHGFFEGDSKLFSFDDSSIIPGLGIITDTKYQDEKNKIEKESYQEETVENEWLWATIKNNFTGAFDSIMVAGKEFVDNPLGALTAMTGGLNGLFTMSTAYAGEARKEEDEGTPTYSDENDNDYYGLATGGEYTKLTQEEEEKIEEMGLNQVVPQALINSANNHYYEQVYRSNFADAEKLGAKIVFPADGVITSPFGYRIHPIFGTLKFHSGVDIGLQYGTPLGAARDGVVTHSGWISGYGYTVIIDHGNGLTSLYGHCSALNVNVGDKVKAGDIISYAGSTGNSTGVHCHFEVCINDQPVDPFSLIGNYKYQPNGGTGGSY